MASVSRDKQACSLPSLLKVRLHSLLADLSFDIWRHDLSQTIQVLANIYLVKAQIVQKRVSYLLLERHGLTCLDSIE